jgi:hypothetical protein
MITAAIKLREPAIATGASSIDLIRTPPSDHRTAVARRSRTYRFNFQFRETTSPFAGRCSALAPKRGDIAGLIYILLLLNSVSSFPLRLPLVRVNPSHEMRAMRYVRRTRTNCSAPAESSFLAPHSERNRGHIPDLDYRG